MGVTAKWRSGVATDAGKMRETNEDRCYIDDERGVFLVVDGVGGHAGGDTAAETALRVIQSELERLQGLTIEDTIRRAITEANNEIRNLARSDPGFEGMGCVLTLAVLQEGRFTIGHVGDSRLYLIWNGTLKKITSDHSPVGEKEDRGELSEEEAMLHPRRHEVFRDVGSRYRSVEDRDFIEIKEFPFKPDAAILMCSDGLSDMLTSSEMLQIIEQYDGNPRRTAAFLVEAANRAGGHDNITAVFVGGSDFIGSGSEEMLEARARHSVTRQRATPRRRITLKDALTTRTAFLIYGFILGILIALLALRLR